MGVPLTWIWSEIKPLSVDDFSNFLTLFHPNYLLEHHPLLFCYILWVTFWGSCHWSLKNLRAWYSGRSFLGLHDLPPACCFNLTSVGSPPPPLSCSGHMRVLGGEWFTLSYPPCFCWCSSFSADHCLSPFALCLCVMVQLKCHLRCGTYLVSSCQNSLGSINTWLVSLNTIFSCIRLLWIQR